MGKPKIKKDEKLESTSNDDLVVDETVEVVKRVDFNVYTSGARLRSVCLRKYGVEDPGADFNKKINSLLSNAIRDLSELGFSVSQINEILSDMTTSIKNVGPVTNIQLMKS